MGVCRQDWRQTRLAKWLQCTREGGDTRWVSPTARPEYCCVVPRDKDLERKARRSLRLRPDHPRRTLSSSAAKVGTRALAPGRGAGGFTRVQVRP